jgi:hypothetical protein
MDKATLQAFLDTFGNRIFCINFDNSRWLYLNYHDSTRVEDIYIEDVGDISFLVVPYSENHDGKIINAKKYHTVAAIQWIGVMDEDSAEWRMDPIPLR